MLEADMSDIDSVLAKEGAELFKEYFRIYPMAEFEDYYNPVSKHWRNDLLRTDYQILAHHRKEAGAPEPVPVEEVFVPNLPKAISRPSVLLAAGAALQEMKELAAFIAKYKMDPPKAKIMMAKLGSAKRKSVMQHFESSGAGTAALAELDSFIKAGMENGFPVDTTPVGDDAKPAADAAKPIASTAEPAVPKVAEPAAPKVTVVATKPVAMATLAQKIAEQAQKTRLAVLENAPEELKEALGKEGPELFREYLRIYPVADKDDYYEAGKWKNDLLRTDLQIFFHHRKEAGAPEPPPLEEVKLPTLLKGIQVAKPAVSVQVAKPALQPAAKPGAIAGVTTGNLEELRLMAQFVAKFKMDPQKAKAVLVKIAGSRRKYVIQKFKSEETGDDAVAALDAFIAECEVSEAWGPVTVAKPVAKPAVIPVVKPAVIPFGGVIKVGASKPLGSSAVRPLVSTLKPASSTTSAKRGGSFTAIKPVGLQGENITFGKVTATAATATTASTVAGAKRRIVSVGAVNGGPAKVAKTTVASVATSTSATAQAKPLAEKRTLLTAVRQLVVGSTPNSSATAAATSSAAIPRLTPGATGNKATLKVSAAAAKPAASKTIMAKSGVVKPGGLLKPVVKPWAAKPLLKPVGGIIKVSKS